MGMVKAVCDLKKQKKKLTDLFIGFKVKPKGHLIIRLAVDISHLCVDSYKFSFTSVSGVVYAFIDKNVIFAGFYRTH